MRQRSRGWIMPEADMVAVLRLIAEKIRSAEIETRHRDTLIRLREILESDLDYLRLNRPFFESSNTKEEAA